MPSLPITQSGSTPPKATPGTLRAGPGGGGGGASPVGGPCGRPRRVWFRATAPLPGSPTALAARCPPPPPPANDVGARLDQRLGAATVPPGHSNVLPGTLPVAAA